MLKLPNILFFDKKNPVSEDYRRPALEENLCKVPELLTPWQGEVQACSPAPVLLPSGDTSAQRQTSFSLT